MKQNQYRNKLDRWEKEDRMCIVKQIMDTVMIIEGKIKGKEDRGRSRTLNLRNIL